MVTLVVGSQWGDEGKGKIIDYLSENADYVVRFHGGNNAGHTIKNNLGTFAFHLIPSGIFHEKATAVIANGTILDLEVLLSEITLLDKAGVKLKNRLMISPRCHLILPYHKLLDTAYEKARGKLKTGTTGRGIGPCYADKVSYNGIRLFDLMDKKQFAEKLKSQLLVKNKLLTALGQQPCRQKDIEKQLFSFISKLKPFIKEPYPLLQRSLTTKRILLEGAQGVFLDNDWGTYPFVTASTVLSGGVTAGAGIPAQKLDRVIGVAKAYATRVGSGPFPTELTNSLGEKLQTIGSEFGATTGRRRRCGWFDAVLVRFATEINGFTSIAITKLDVLDTFEEIKICVGYTYKGKRVDYTGGDSLFLAKVKPLYKTLPGWMSRTQGITDYKKLPNNAIKYVKALEKEIQIPVSLISTGQEREAIITK